MIGYKAFDENLQCRGLYFGKSEEDMKPRCKENELCKAV